MQLPSLPRPDARWFTGLGVGLIAGVLAVGAVTAASPAPSAGTTAPGGTAGTVMSTTAAQATTTPHAGRPGLRFGALRHALGRNFRVAIDATNAKGTRHILYVRGTLAVSTDSVTVTLPDSSKQAFTVDARTIVRVGGARVPLSSLTDGEHALVFGTRNDDGSYTAKLIRGFKNAKPATP